MVALMVLSGMKKENTLAGVSMQKRTVFSERVSPDTSRTQTEPRDHPFLLDHI